MTAYPVLTTTISREMREVQEGRWAAFVRRICHCCDTVSPSARVDRVAAMLDAIRPGETDKELARSLFVDYCCRIRRVQEQW